MILFTADWHIKLGQKNVPVQWACSRYKLFFEQIYEIEKDVDFIYDRKKGYLYFNENGSKKGFGDGGIIAIFKDSPKLSLTNLVYIRETLRSRKKYNNKSADKITNFHPSSEKIAIKVKGFGIKDSPSFKPAKNRKEVKKLAKKDIDFLYDQKKGGLYFNENGAEGGFGDGGIVAILKGAPEIASEHLIFL